MLNIYLARHGQDQDNVDSILNGQRDMPLTEKGIEQAKEAAQKIKDAGIIFDRVYTSPLQRARKTAEIISETVDAPKPEVLQDLIERDFGVMTGKSHSQIKELCSPDILVTETVIYFLSPQGAETFPQLIVRANRLIADLNKRHKDGNILLVSHGDIGKMIYCAYYKLDWQNVLKMFHFGNSEILILSPNSKAEDSHSFYIQQHNL